SYPPATYRLFPYTTLFRSLVVYMDIAGMTAEDFSVEFADGILTIGGERKPRREGKPHYHAMEVQVGPFERRFRLPVAVDPDTIRSEEHTSELQSRSDLVCR